MSIVKRKQERINELMAKLLEMQFEDEDDMSKEELKEHHQKIFSIKQEIDDLSKE
jgi:hypothetical protein